MTSYCNIPDATPIKITLRMHLEIWGNLGYPQDKVSCVGKDPMQITNRRFVIAATDVYSSRTKEYTAE